MVSDDDPRLPANVDVFPVSQLTVSNYAAADRLEKRRSGIAVGQLCRGADPRHRCEQVQPPQRGRGRELGGAGGGCEQGTDRRGSHVAEVS